MSLLKKLGDVLPHPTKISRNLGVAPEAEMKKRLALVVEIRAALNDVRNRDATEELDILLQFGGETDRSERPEANSMLDGDREPPQRSEHAGQGGRTKTTFHTESAAGRSNALQRSADWRSRPNAIFRRSTGSSWNAPLRHFWTT